MKHYALGNGQVAASYADLGGKSNKGPRIRW